MTTPVPAKDKNHSAEQRKELLAAIDALARRGGITRDRAITAWYASTLLGIDEDDAIDAASVDGPEDGGCDFIFIDDDQELIYVLQGYVSNRPDRSAGIKKWNALLAAISSVRDPVSFKHAGRDDIYERLTEGTTEGYSLVLALISLAGKSIQIARHLESTRRAKTYGANVSFIYEHQETLYDRYLVARAASRNVQSDTLSFTGEVGQIKGEFGQAIVGAVGASELVRLYTVHKNQLFEGNVRLFIGQRKGGINEKIVETAKGRPGDFWALNNGITIVSNTFEAVTERKYKLQHFSIVNGCQTTVSLSKAVESSADAGLAQVLVRVVAAKKTLLTDIVRYNNTQNPVKLSAVRLLDPIQEGLREAFSRIDYSYAPKQEGARQSKNSKRIELDKAAQYLASMSAETILQAVNQKMELFDRFYKTVFPRGLAPEKVFLAWLIAREVEVNREALLTASDDQADKVMRTILGIHGTQWGIYVATYLIEQSGSDMSNMTLARMNTDEFRNAVAKYARKAMELYSEIAVNVVNADEDENIRNVIRVKPFLDKLNRNLKLRMTRFATWRLPKLHAVATQS